MLASTQQDAPGSLMCGSAGLVEENSNHVSCLCELAAKMFEVCLVHWECMAADTAPSARPRCGTRPCIHPPPPLSSVPQSAEPAGVPPPSGNTAPRGRLSGWGTPATGRSRGCRCIADGLCSVSPSERVAQCPVSRPTERPCVSEIAHCPRIALSQPCARGYQSHGKVASGSPCQVRPTRGLQGAPLRHGL